MVLKTPSNRQIPNESLTEEPVGALGSVSIRCKIPTGDVPSNGSQEGRWESVGALVHGSLGMGTCFRCIPGPT